MEEDGKIVFERSWFREAFSHADEKAEGDIEYFGTSRLKVADEYQGELETVEIDADEIIDELEAEDEEVNFLEAGTLRHGME